MPPLEQNNPPDESASEQKPEAPYTNQGETENPMKEAVGEQTWLRPLRTYKTDVSEALKKQGGSLTRIILAEKRREETEEKEKQKNIAEAAGSGERTFEEESARVRALRKNIIVIISGVLLLAVGAGITYATYLFLSAPDASKPFELSQNIISVEKEKEIPLSELSEEELSAIVKKEIKETKMQAGQIEAIYFTKKLLGGAPGEVSGKPSTGIIGTRELFVIVKNNMPPNLLRSFGDQEFLYGIHALAENKPFIILKTDSFENAFSGMLKWETYMLEDLQPLFSFGLSTQQLISRSSFTDSVIRNNDVRALKNDRQEIVLVYAFVDRETLVIAQTRETFEEVVTRLKTPKKIIR